jgi:ATP-dependent Clp protease ATP-binding subunit ClpA
MFERFTEQSVRVIMYSQEESRLLGHSHVGTEHFLLGLLRVGPGIAARALREVGVELSAAREKTEKIVGHGEGFVISEMPFTEECKQVLERSWNESKRLDNNYIGTHHLLLGLVRKRDEICTSLGCKILEELGVDIEILISKIEQMLAEEKPLETNSRFSPRYPMTETSWNEKTYYQVLQVDPKAEIGLIAEVYRYLSEKYHPESLKAGDKEKYDMIENAWIILKDENKRLEYDASLKRK